MSLLGTVWLLLRFLIKMACKPHHSSPLLTQSQKICLYCFSKLQAVSVRLSQLAAIRSQNYNLPQAAGTETQQ